MYIIPAIDLRQGKCVRLLQGEYHRQITYQDNPVKQAKEFISAGAEWLHIVDLDGAKVGKPINTEAISAIAALRQLKIELGGGIRDEAAIEQILDILAGKVDIDVMNETLIALYEDAYFRKLTVKDRLRIPFGVNKYG